MANHDQPDNQDSTPVTPAMPTLSAKGAARRRLAGLGASGVLLTVASSSAMADMVCKSPSGALSGDLNSHAPDQVCAGRSPAWWAKNTNQFPPGVGPKTRFEEIFPTSDQIGHKHVIKVLEGRGNTGRDDVPALMLATWFNVNANPPFITFLTPQAVKDMWANYDSTNTYRPDFTSESWDSAQFADYLASTQIPSK